MLQAQHFARIQQSTQTGQTTNQHRNPLANAEVNRQQTPPKLPQKTPVSPPLPRQNSKTTPPSPPKIITDKSGRLQYNRVGFLGEASGSNNLCWPMVLIYVRRVVLPVFMRLKTQKAHVSLAR